MKLNSKYFDSIRVAPKREADKGAEEKHPRCQWKGCDRPAPHRAPKGRGRDGEYFAFCVDHVREYNAAYNYFDGMSDAEVSDFQKDAMTGHRPTWKVGVNSWAHGTSARQSGAGGAGTGGFRAHDPHGLFAERARQAREEPIVSRRVLKPIEKKSLEALHLPETASKPEIKARFKELVKRHHPDSNGGDTRSADTLREIIQAYNYLKKAGLV
ncbi:DnaJ domain-containing protein [Hyphomicrobium sp.]|uniref:J domain-containing protein n=1 Tax=Hyphomicrobium sp. TaxID=82 RepID=UPI0025B99903|nr:DnaJ domain-containing protein [Hyphomicrobium sp.]MCC7251147.1 DnaJ domain-containing protein [Hyphomicrobium sp.]